MPTEELIFVTGATGFLGARLVRELLDRQPQARLALLIRNRAQAGQSAQQRASQIVPPSEQSRVQVYSGDVSLPNCGLESAAYQQLAQKPPASSTPPPPSASTTRWKKPAAST
jgi:thioester reductase-like protein